ncbi:Aldehyde/histidinol dehydrogenase [Aspergillus foveolatus]|uniref:Aldehyde/histidinol dehydrogenase n=1 Tax=Aspergillus foveolatus TaxID=210207 RepID=UPI003CCD70F4
MSLASLKRKDLFQQHGLIGDKWVSSSGGGTFTNGKTLAEANGEVVYAASFLEWFAGEAERVHGEVVPASNANQRILTVKQPLGVAACLAPRNFPIAMITRKVMAALAAGCTTVWKPAGETPLSALAQAVLAKEAGFPSGTINVITTLNNVAEPEQHYAIPSLCGSSALRARHASASSWQASAVKILPSYLWNSAETACLLFSDDAKVDTAVEACILAKFRNSGQTCATANRIFVREGIYGRFSAALVEKVKALKVGNGVEEGVFIGPLTHELEKAHIKDAQEKGASLVLGGSPCQPNNLQGYFVEPTVLGKMSTQALTTREKVFAPVVALYPFKTEEEVLAKAKDCDVGLGSYVITESMPRMLRVAENLEVGMVGINMGTLSAAESPFGGGIEEYMTVKSILMNVAA